MTSADIRWKVSTASAEASATTSAKSTSQAKARRNFGINVPRSVVIPAVTLAAGPGGSQRIGEIVSTQ
ncbi:hypothetical protein GCM10010297_11070 [Streptomyces malachitofuscus]|nr:hypothetical protein GCM10010297_11070 [Streptomyces malachitofuscus]